MNDYYAILGVSQAATQAEIKDAYRKLSKALHPDVNPNGASLMVLVNEAYETLSDPVKRAAYRVRPIPQSSPKVTPFPESPIRSDGSINLVAIAGRFTPAQMQEQIFPALERLLSDRGIHPRAATLNEVLEATGMLPKKKGRKRA